MSVFCDFMGQTRPFRRTRFGPVTATMLAAGWLRDFDLHQLFGSPLFSAE
jgi:hypothetical protein